MKTLQELYTNPARDKAWSARGEETIKIHSKTGSKFINYLGSRYYLASMRVDLPLDSELDYIFSYKFLNPDTAMELSIDKRLNFRKYGTLSPFK